MRVAIIGCGFVGSAVANSYRDTDVGVLYCDPKLEFSVDIPTLISWRPDAYFVCVPTPSLEDNGACNDSIVRRVLFELRGVKDPVIIKSTIMPDLFRDIHNIPGNLFHIPEFLRQSTANEDYINQKLCIIGRASGVDNEDLHRVIKLLSASKINPDCHIHVTDVYTSCIVKYVMNGFLAAKVVLMNQFRELADEYNVTWEDVTELLEMDSRMGTSHFQVPGPDGKFGYGGACLPKDVDAIIAKLTEADRNYGIMNTVRETNRRLRDEK